METTVDVLGADHPSASVLRSNLAQDLKALGRSEEAEVMHTAAVAGLRDRLGEQHPAYGNALAWRRANCDVDPMPL